MTLQVFIVEDHFIMRETLSDLIKKELGFTVSGSAATGEEALRELATVAANLVLVDLALPGMSGLELVQALQVRQPELSCLILSGYSEVTYVQRAFDAGARGYVLKGKPPDILEGIQAVAGGRTYLSPAIQAKLSGEGR